jgi:hypothetical protein
MEQGRCGFAVAESCRDGNFRDGSVTYRPAMACSSTGLLRVTISGSVLVNGKVMAER